MIILGTSGDDVLNAPEPIRRVSTDAAGAQANNANFQASFSPDGKKVVFQSWATNLTAGDTVHWDIFVKDLETGLVTKVSTNSDGLDANNSSFRPVFSPDGTKVAFMSEATNLVAGDTNNSADIFIKDLITGAVTRVSTDGNGSQVSGGSDYVTFSPDGLMVAFSSSSGGLVPGDFNGAQDIFIKDLASGAITRISLRAGTGMTRLTAASATMCSMAAPAWTPCWAAPATTLWMGEPALTS